MQCDLDAVVEKLARLRRRLLPMQVAGGRLTALEVRSIVTDLDRCVVETRMAGRRVGELLQLIVTLGEDEPKPAPREPLRLVGGEPSLRTSRWAVGSRYRFKLNPEPPDDDRPEAA